MTHKCKVLIAIPVYNGGDLWASSAASIKACLEFFSCYDFEICVIDSGSTDNSVSVSRSLTSNVVEINNNDFNHGATRNMFLSLNPDFEFVIFLTQDSILDSKESLVEILKPFSNKDVSIVFGRQMPHSNATPLAIHSRFFNYGDKSYIRRMSDKYVYGMKTVFCSNSFSAFRVSVFSELNGFPSNTILSEDMYLASKILLNGGALAYSSNALVKHSHNYTLFQEFSRYFDIGVFHAQEPWIRQSFGGASGEGVKYALSEIKFLYDNCKILIPRSIVLSMLKFVGFKLGLKYKLIPKGLIKKISMHKGFWK
ncbi:glycosyltransferase [uncultured Tolumonas sp.]|uniref:glycosyltransferase family 2 protein n=1 Tax=uncultured Tolumonas sp. TaxID=263765 RepID=UPI002930FD7B|nr:glycosyltransferase [uncultured Tolumonas sp.]